MAKKMFVSDFDYTLVNFHGHALSQQANFPPITDKLGVIVRLQDGIYQQEGKTLPLQDDPSEEQIMGWLTDPTKGTKFAKEIVGIWVKMLEEGDFVSVVSYSLYPRIITTTLKYMFEQHAPDKKDLLNKIYIITGYPKDADAGKEEHIAKAIAEVAREEGIEIKRKDCLLVDDDPRNIQVAVNKQFLFVLNVPGSMDEVKFKDGKPEYITEIETMLKTGCPLTFNEKLATGLEVLDTVAYQDYLEDKGYRAGEDYANQDFDEVYESFINEFNTGYWDNLLDKLVTLKQTKSDYTVEDVHSAVSPLVETFFTDEPKEDEENEDDMDVENENTSATGALFISSPSSPLVQSSPLVESSASLPSDQKKRTNSEDDNPKNKKRKND